MHERKLIFSARRKDFDIQWFSGRGAGGQYRNKHQNCCRIIHRASGLTAQGTEHRERPANQRAAFRRLAAALVDYYGLRNRPKPAKSSERIRTYHEPRNEVLDHASGHRQTFTDVVEGATIGEMIEARKRTLGG